jgi:hypothetical protein
MENNLDNAKKFLVDNNFEVFAEDLKNVIGKTMRDYAEIIFKAKLSFEKRLITLDKNILKENESFFSVISKIDNFLKIEPVLISDKNDLVKKEMNIKFKYKKNATLYCKHFNSAFDNGKSLEECEKIALEKLKIFLG